MISPVLLGVVGTYALRLEAPNLVLRRETRSVPGGRAVVAPPRLGGWQRIVRPRTGCGQQSPVRSGTQLRNTSKSRIDSVR